MSNYKQTLKQRYAALGAIVLLVLGLLAVRLWTMQVLQGKDYAAQAENNRVRDVTTIAPRGRILDRHGKPLVANRPTLAVVVDREVASNKQLLQRLSALLNIPIGEITDRANSVKEAALAPRVVAIDVPMDRVAYLVEHQSQFPGVEVQTRAVREYPQGKLAAHVLGYAGEISDTELGDPAFTGYDPTDMVGKSGAERAFESALQGDRGMKRIEVNASGVAQHVMSQIEPVSGRDVELTIDSKLQRVTEKALAQALTDAHKQHFNKAKAGAAVVMNADTGEILAMASAPTYDPSLFLGGVSQKTWESLTTTSSEYPLSNRAIAGQYPAASTFKAFTGLAGLQSGITSPWKTYHCEGKWTGMGKQWKKYCWNRYGHGLETFVDGIRDSCDVVFYEIGYDFYKDGHEKLQKYARQFGFGSKTGIDLPGEAAGRVPDAAWKKSFNENYPEYQQWLPGDTVNMAIGQGDILVTPLQITTAYAAIANNGKVMQPHLLKAVMGSDGKVALRSKPKVASTPDVSKANLATMRSALREVVTEGTAKSVFRGFTVPIAGKTGTGQVAGKDDYAWFVGYAPVDNPKYVVTVLVEQGGHGGSVAGPAARQIFAALFGEHVEHVTAQDNSR